MADIRHVLFFLDSGNKLLTGDTIEHAGEWWLVPAWNITQDGRERQPQRMIALAPFGLNPSRFAGHDWTTSKPIPKDLIEGPGLPDAASGFRVLILPDLWIRTPVAH
jgi:hypothetical protein